MAKKSEEKKAEEPVVDPGDQNDKTPEVKAAGPPTTVGFVTGNLLDAARMAGFLDVQIAKYTDPAMLKQAVLRVKPALAHMFVDKPAAGRPRPAPVKERAVFAFDARVRAGYKNLAKNAEAEQQQIDAAIRRRGIALHDLVAIDIRRSCTADNGNLISTVTVTYWRVADDS